MKKPLVYYFKNHTNQSEKDIPFNLEDFNRMGQ